MRKYCESIFETRRRTTREVKVGDVGVGGGNPVRIQSMTTSNTRDIQATIDQIMRLSDAGCEIARVTVQGKKEAQACEAIKSGLQQRGYTIPLVADIHFYPPAAMLVADFVDKVRINPGNFVDKRASFQQLSYSDASYRIELERIQEKFAPLVEKCKSVGCAMRIGTNHGSLSDRIMSHYGDTPKGMVESAVEFAQIARDLEYHDLIFSMKASNPLVMVQAYRLLTARMIELGWDYPLHLGVTEAGDGEDGRVKSAVGIGSLLLDGLGDTIRVSLTEDPWREIAPCQQLVQLALEAEGCGVAPFEEHHRNFEEITLRKVVAQEGVPLHLDGTVALHLDATETRDAHLGIHGLTKSEDAIDLIWLKEGLPTATRSHLQSLGIGLLQEGASRGALAVLSLKEVEGWLATRERTRRFALSLTDSPHPPYAIRLTGEEEPQAWQPLLAADPALLLLGPQHNRLHAVRRFYEWMTTHKLSCPVLLHFQYDCAEDDLTIRASSEIGALLCDGLGDGLCLEGPYPPNRLRLLSFAILQAARRRATRTEFIACPSCGRTLFDLQEVTQQIRKRTNHLPGVKIAVMGCIVNGPGEMADADFGYVGSTPGKIDLYVGRERVQRQIDQSEACERLVDLIKAHDRWVEPPKQELSCV